MPKYRDELDTVLRALADPTRRAVVERLAKGPAVVSDLAEPFDMALPSLMQHLRVLEAAGVTTSEKQGRVRAVSLRPGALDVLHVWLGEQRTPAEHQADHLGIHLPAPPRRRPDMTRVHLELFSSIDGRTSTTGQNPENPMGEDWGRLTAAHAATRTFRERVLNDTSGGGTTGLDDHYVARHHDGIGAEIMGAAMFGLHAFPDDPGWKGWWGEEPPFRAPVYVLTSSVPRQPIPMPGGTTFHFRNAPIEEVLAEATEAAAGQDVRVGGGVSTARAFLRAGLVDELHVMVAPIVLGQGEYLWEDLRGLEETHAVTSEVAVSGTIHVTFSRKIKA